ncbi:MAG: MFS transporter [Pseudomonadota bacterium]
MSPSQDNTATLGGARAWFVWSLSALAFGYAFVQRVAPSVMVSDLMADFAIGGGMLGVLSGLYFYPYVFLQIPLGALLDRLGARVLLVTALTMAGVGSALLGVAESVWLAYLGRGLVGAGSAVGFLASLALAGRWFPPRRFALMAGLTMVSGMTFGVLGQGPMALVVEAVGWRHSQFGLAGAAFLLAALVALIVRNGPPGEVREEHTAMTWGQLAAASRDALSRWIVWKVALVAAAMSGPMLVFGGLWGTPYLMETYGLDKAQAAFTVSIILAGWAVGAPLSGWLSDVLNRRKGLVLAGCGAMTLAIAAIVVLPGLPLWVVMALLALTGFGGSFMVLTFAIVREQVPPALGGTALGAVNSMTVMSGAVLQPAVGIALDALWDGRMAAGSRLYGTTDYQLAFGLMLATGVAGFVLAVILPGDGEASSNY